MISLKVFVDFDGTITKEDVGNAFFRKYAGRDRYDAILVEYKAGRISAQECFRRGIEAMGQIDRKEAAAFVRYQQVDHTFKDFTAFCHERNIDLCVVSDGLDFYIHEIFAEQGIVHAATFSNSLEFDERSANGLRINFPYADVECTRCACCKRNIMLTHAGEDNIIVYVGEGYSDRCPAQYADIVFAKDTLQTFCQEENISYFLYQSFRDVQERLSALLDKKRLRKCRTAELKRKKLFMREP